MQTGDNIDVIDETENEPDETETEETEGEESSESDEYVAPSKEEFAKFKREQERRGKKINDLKAQLKKFEDDSKSGLNDVEKATQKAREEEAAKYKNRVINSEATAALTKLGLKPEVDAKRLLKMLDLDEIDIDSDDEILGLDTQLDDLKSGFPDLFDSRKATKADTRTRQDAADKPPAKKTETGQERLARMMLTGK